MSLYNPQGDLNRHPNSTWIPGKYLMWQLHVSKRKSLEINRSEKAGPHQHVFPNHFSRTMAKSDVAQWPIDVWLFTTPWTEAHQASLSFTISQSLLKLTSIEWMMLSNHLILCHPLLLLSSIFPSIRVFSSEWALHIRWPKYWSFSFNLSLSNEYSPCSPRGSQESSPAPQFKSIYSSVLSFLYSPALTFVHDYWKNHSFD